ncbi:MAG: hypothetical protein AAYR33_00665 [Acetobacteraceae bacterium]
MTAQSSPFRGLVDFYENGVARGWAIHLNRRDPLYIHVLIDGQEVAAVAAASPRPDLGSLIKSGEQNIGFTFDVPAPYLDGQARALSFRFPDGSIVPVSVSGTGQDFTEELLIGDDASQQITGYFEGLLRDRWWVGSSSRGKAGHWKAGQRSLYRLTGVILHASKRIASAGMLANPSMRMGSVASQCPCPRRFVMESRIFTLSRSSHQAWSLSTARCDHPSPMIGWRQNLSM